MVKIKQFVERGNFKNGEWSEAFAGPKKKPTFAKTLNQI